jgi:retron-type reverse transcriptase
MKEFVSTDIGVPQGGIISPLLSNLVLHELDIFIEKLISERNEKSKGIKPRKNNPEYQRLNSRIHRLQKQLNTERNITDRET